MPILCRGAAIWKVFSKIPEGENSPPKVRFKYLDRDWQEVVPADSYSITPSYDPTRYYTVTFKGYKNRGICGYNQDDVIWTSSRNFKGDFKLVVVSSSCQDNPWSNDGTYCWRRWGIVHNGGELRTGNFLHWSGYGEVWEVFSGCKVNNDIYNCYSNVPPWIDSVTPYEDAPIFYNLKIFYKGDLKYEETQTIEPLVEIVPESNGCEYPVDWDLEYEEINLNPNAYLESSQSGVNISLSRCELSENNGEILNNCRVIKEILGTCNVPLILGKQENLCPNGTCELFCNGCLCCYNSLGYAVKSYCGGIV